VAPIPNARTEHFTPSYNAYHKLETLVVARVIS